MGATQPRRADFAALLTGVALVFGCGSRLTFAPPAPACPEDDDASVVVSVTASSSVATSGGGATPGVNTELDERVLDYGEALRIASIKLNGDLPDLATIRQLDDADDQATTYAQLVDGMLEDARFAAQMIAMWRDLLRLPRPAAGYPDRETGARFAARLVVEGRPLADLFTKDDNTCPGFDGTQFVDGDCFNRSSLALQGAAVSGLLTDPSLVSAHHGNMAFRVTRVLHELFTCRSAREVSPEPDAEPAFGSYCSGTKNTPVDYSSPWPIDSIAGSCNGGAIDFHAAQDDGPTCAACHGTFNHRALLWANFDDAGLYQDEVSVRIPVEDYPWATRSDFLPDGEASAYEHGAVAATLSELGKHMLADRDVHACLVRRFWAWAMSQGDVLEARVPADPWIVQELLFTLDSTSMRGVLRAIFVHEDFVRF